MRYNVFVGSELQGKLLAIRKEQPIWFKKDGTPALWAVGVSIVDIAKYIAHVHGVDVFAVTLVLALEDVDHERHLDSEISRNEKGCTLH